MKNLKTIIGIISIIVKYGAVVMAIIKGIEVVHSELEKINLDDTKPDPVKIAENE